MEKGAAKARSSAQQTMKLVPGSHGTELFLKRPALMVKWVSFLL